MANETSWFFESAADRGVAAGYSKPHCSFGVYQKDDTKTFNERFNDLCESYKMSNIDIKSDMSKMITDRNFMEQYKSDLIDEIASAFMESSPDDPHMQSMADTISSLWDAKVKKFTESASITGYLPISTLEFPVLVKQFYASVMKDIIDIESTKTPSITKHIRETLLVDNETGEEYEYPKCLWDGTWEKIWNAAKGHKINEQVVELTNGRLQNYDIVTNLTAGTKGIDKLSFQFKIVGVKVGDEVCRIPGNGISVEFSTNGTLINGDLKFKTPNGTEVDELIAGQVNYKEGTISLAAVNGQVTGVVFAGYLSNEKNIRNVSVRERRRLLRFNIEDGARWNMPFSIEEIEDAAALLDINYYNRMVDEIVKTQEMIESMECIKWLMDEYDKYYGIDTDVFKLESLVKQFSVDLTPPPYFAGDPFKYRSSVIQFKLKSIIHQLVNDTKLDGLSFIIVGNPMATQLITEFVNWKTVSGSNIGGISVNSSYGFATDIGANVRVVASNLYDAYSAEAVEDAAGNSARELVLHIIGYPTDSEHISFKHLKYTSHLFTSQSQTAYQSTLAPAGAYNIVTATSRYKNLAVQGIQARLYMLHSAEIYGPAPANVNAAGETVFNGAPWASTAWPSDPVTPTPPVNP